MKLAILPDMHIKFRDKASDFYFTDDELYDFLIKIGNEADKVIFCGDLAELWQGKWPTTKSERAEFYKLKSQYPKTIQLIESDDKYSSIEGNHDDHLSKIDEIKHKISKEIVISTPNGKIIINHGIMDIMNKNLTLRKVASCGSWIVGLLERLVYRNWEIIVNKFFMNVFHLEVVGTNLQQMKNFKLRMEEDDDIICCINGHTHKPQIIRFPYNNKDRLFINCGFFNGVENYYCFLDTDTMEISPHKIIDTDFKKFKLTLNKGDVLLTYKKDNAVSYGIAKVTNSDYSHALLYLGNGRIIEATGKGVHLNTIDEYLDGMHDVCKVSLIDQSKIDTLVDNTLKRIGTKYGFVQNAIDFLYIIIYGITGKDLRKSIEIKLENVVVCSQLVAEEVKSTYSYADINASNFFPSDFLKYPAYFKFEHKITVTYK